MASSRRLGAMMLLGALFAAPGCSARQLSAAVFEGLRAREAVEHPADPVRAASSPSFSQYEAERSRALGPQGG